MNALVGILIVSDSDLPGVQEACTMLTELSVPYALATLPTESASETVVQKFEADGCSVYICVAENVTRIAHDIAAQTTRPVIAVPLLSASASPDALYAALGMPSDVPVATVAVNGIKNAALLAAQIISSFDTEVRAKVTDYKVHMAEDVQAKNVELEKLGTAYYVKNMRI